MSVGSTRSKACAEWWHRSGNALHCTDTDTDTDVDTESDTDTDTD